MLETAAQERERQSSVVQTTDAVLVTQSSSRRSLVERSPRIIATTWTRVSEQAVDVRRFWTVSLARLSFLLVVMVPTLCAAFYATAWGTSRYLSEFRASVQTISQMKGGGIAELFGFSGLSQEANASQAVVQYLQSRQVIEEVSKDVDLRKLYADPSVDWFSRLTKDAQIEDFTRYWNRMVSASYETSTGTIVVGVSAFDPAASKKVASLLLTHAEHLVNDLSARAREDSVTFAEREVAKAEQRVSEVRQRMRTLQDRVSMLDPQKSAESTLMVVTKLQEELAHRRADLSTQRSQMSDLAPSVQATKNVIAGLEAEVLRLRQQITAPKSASPSVGGDKPLSSVLGEFEEVKGDQIFAEKALMSALSSLETARMDANRQQIYLATIVRPALPQEVSFPRPIRMTTMTFLVTASLWLIGLLGVYSVREHM